MKQVDRQDDEEQFEIHDVRGECFAPHLALMLKSEWHKFTCCMTSLCTLICMGFPWHMVGSLALSIEEFLRC